MRTRIFFLITLLAIACNSTDDWPVNTGFKKEKITQEKDTLIVDFRHDAISSRYSNQFGSSKGLILNDTTLLSNEYNEEHESLIDLSKLTIESKIKEVHVKRIDNNTFKVFVDSNYRGRFLPLEYFLSSNTHVLGNISIGDTIYPEKISLGYKILSIETYNK